jgi:hypothetical protein
MASPVQARATARRINFFSKVAHPLRVGSAMDAALARHQFSIF